MKSLPYKVYYRERGESKKDLMAKFAERVDAVNFAYACSNGRFGQMENVSMLVIDGKGKVNWRYVQGVRQ
ncbi:MAG: hypothetical protein V3S33_02250 [Gammaproteobacteria bacterium]